MDKHTTPLDFNNEIFYFFVIIREYQSYCKS